MTLLKDIDDSHFMMRDVKLNCKSKKNDTLICVRCKNIYKRGTWDFYSLCNDCFAEFDTQKMEGRFGGKKHYEDVWEWIQKDVPRNS